MPYRWIYCLLIPFGAVTKVDVVWAWGDLMNALQVFPNLIGLIGLSGIVAQDRHDESGSRPSRQADLAPVSSRFRLLIAASRCLLGSLPQFQQRQWVATIGPCVPQVSPWRRTPCRSSPATRTARSRRRWAA